MSASLMKNAKNGCKSKVKKKMQINMLYSNVRGLVSKIPSVKEVLACTDTTIACLAETHLSDNKGVKIDGYTFFGRAREGRNGGGVGIIVKNTMKKRISPHYSVRNIEIMWISISRTPEKPLYVGIYYGKQESCSMDEMKEEVVGGGKAK